VVLDPIGGGDESNGIGPGGLRGATVNLNVARLVRGFLEQAGAEVELTRSYDAELTGFIRVQRAEDFGAQRVVQIARSSSDVSWVGHFPGSTRGRALSELLQAQFQLAESEIGTTYEGSPLPAVQIREYANHVLQQTSSPAVSIRAADLSVSAGEERFLNPAWLHREAYLIFLALAQDFLSEIPEGEVDPADTMVDVEIRIRDADKPLAEVGVQLAGMLLVTGKDGVVRFDLLDPSVYHLLTVSWGEEGGAREAWIHPGQGRTWSWQRGAAKPEAVKPKP
jgi:hypothetical protein